MKKMKSIKTTIAGIAAGVALIAPQIVNICNGDPVSIDLIVAGLAAMGCGWFARDNSVTSEDAGAK